jgi:hypothetical protein
VTTTVFGRSMTRVAYDARRRAAFNALRDHQNQMQLADYADSPGWVRSRLEQRTQSIVESVPSPYSWVEAFFLRQCKMRRDRVLMLISERAQFPSCADRCTRELRETLDCWKRMPVHMVPVPLPRDRLPVFKPELRAAA